MRTALEVADVFRRIRHYGFLANGHRVAKLAICRRLLTTPPPAPLVPPADYRERYRRLTGRSLEICRCCGGLMKPLGARRPARSAWPDTS